jgi:hypothetical protein
VCSCWPPGEDGTFEDRTAGAGLADVRGVHAAAWADVDGDRDLDLYLAAWRGASRLFLQGAGGLFEDASRPSGLPSHAEPLSAQFLDYDGDGRPDLHLVTAHDDLVFHNAGEGRFEAVRTGIVPRVRVPGAPGATFGTAPVGEPLAPVPGSASAGAPATRDGAALAPPVNARTAQSGGIVTQPLAAICAQYIEDQATPNCIQVSTDPMLGFLYPISSTWFVSPTGRVGINTTSPAATLDVNGVARAQRWTSTVATGTAPLTVSSTTKVANLNVDQIDGLDSTAFRLVATAITGGDISNGTITDADVSATAAIAGTKVSPDFGAQLVQGAAGADFNGVTNVPASRGTGLFGPTNGYLGGQGVADFDGVATADWVGYEMGVVGISTGASIPDNYGVMGHSNNVAVRGEHSASPTTDFAELGLAGIGLRASGATRAAEFIGPVDIAGISTLNGGNSVLTTLTVRNELNGGAGHFSTVDTPGVFTNATLIATNDAEGGAVLATQGNAAATSAAMFVSTQSTSSINRALHVVKMSASTGDVAFIDANNTGHSGIVLNVRQRGTGRGLQVDAQGGGVAGFMQATGNVLDLNNTSNVGSILEARNATDIEFRVDSSGNVFCDGAFTGGGADYAEWLERLVASEDLEPGDVVGVFGGRVTRTTAGAEHVLVVSTNPCLVGNNAVAENDTRDGHEQVAFLGQVPVRVRGPVVVGDLLVPSGAGDGTARAVAPAALDAATLRTVFATAWQAHEGHGEGLVNAALGIDQARGAARVVDALAARLEAQEEALAELTAVTAALVERLEQLEGR